MLDSDRVSLAAKWPILNSSTQVHVRTPKHESSCSLAWRNPLPWGHSSDKEDALEYEYGNDADSLQDNGHEEKDEEQEEA